jgi:hypothetical protein
MPIPEPSGTAAGATPRWLVATVLGLGILLGLVALFVLGTRLGNVPVAAPVPTSSSPVAPTTNPSTPSPAAASAPATGPVPAGVHGWAELRGGECLDPFTSAWQARYTVVDCGLPHAAQLIARAPIEASAAAPFPGEEAIVAPLNLACTAPAVLDSAAAAAYTDLQSQPSYPVSAEQWASGQRDYLCFISRASGDLLTSNVAVF